MCVQILSVLTYPLDNVDHEHGVLLGIHPDSTDYSDYDYDNKDDMMDDQSSGVSLPMSEADKKMQEILKNLPMITTKRPAR